MGLVARPSASQALSMGEPQVSSIGRGAVLKGRYRIERVLGRGGMASVWLATDEVLERPVAIKVLSDGFAADPEFVARFSREARVAAGVRHPNLIGVYDYGEGQERPYLVMEYVPGGNLAERLAEGAKVDPERLARELLGAVAHIHAAGIVHRDIKPQNVLLAPDGSAKLIDFGIALPPDATSITRTGNLLGTARYLAPEVMDGQPASERSDLYSCGLVLRDCIGEDTPGRLGTVVEQLSAKDPAARPASAAAALARIERRPVRVDEPTERFEVAEQPAQAPPEPPPPRLPTQRAPNPAWRRIAAGLAAVAALAVAFFVLTDGDGQDGGGKRPAQVATGKRAGSGDAGKQSAAVAPAPKASEAAENSEPPEPEAAESAGGEASAGGGVATPAVEDAELGSIRNQEGYELIQAGRPEDAVPLLEEAVGAYPEGSEDLEYAYALFNLGNALRLSGRPDEAIPILQRRLEIPNQTDVVESELAAAESEAG
jgi:serine/threonine protein kinase